MSSFAPRHSTSMYCLSRNCWIFGRVLYDCYGEDSLRTWLLDDKRVTINVWLDNDGKVTDVNQSFRRKHYSIPIDLDSIRNYIIGNDIRFEICCDVLDWNDEAIIDSTFASGVGLLRFIQVGFPGVFYDTSDVECTNEIIESLQKPFYLLRKGVTQHLTQKEYNECLLLSSLINLLGDWKVYKLCLDGFHLIFKLSLSKDQIPIDGIVLDSFELFDRENLLHQLLSMWQFYNIPFLEDSDNPDHSIIISLNKKISNRGEFMDELYKCMTGIRNFNNELQ